MELTSVHHLVRSARSREGLLAAARRRLRLLPEEEPLGPVEYRAALVVFVAAMCVAAIAVAIFTVRPPHEWVTFGIGTLTIALISAYSVRSLTAVNTSFSVAIFVHLGLTLVLGPVGAAGGAIADAIGTSQRLRPGWFRAAFNIADYFLANVGAWVVFREVSSLGRHPLVGAVAGLVAGITQGLLNIVPLGGVLRLATRGEITVVGFVRRSVSMAPYFLGYGLAADAFVLLESNAGPVGFVLVLTPVLLLQGFLVYLARRMHVYEEETKAHQEARVRLLQRAIDASNEERERIAASIHDGVVQELAGLSFSLGAYAHTQSHDPNGHDQQAILKLVREASETARRATRDLRTLIIEIAPPKLKEQGLGAALGDLLANVGSGPKTELHLDDGLRLDDSTNRLIYRVAQEAVRNSTKYAHAENLSIQVAYDGADVVLRVADDGRGFDAVEQDRQLAEGHVGLGLLQRTVADGGGSLRIASEPGGGTTVEMRAPRAPATDAVP